jgi:O-antigen/teichoic acid export membrane protein
MRAHLSNAAYSILDYVAQPACMLVAAPILVHHLGLAQYGLWLIASAAVSAGSSVSSGFGDAVIQRIAALRAIDDLPGIRRVIANMLAVNLLLGTAVAVVLSLLIPTIATHITRTEPSLHNTALWSLRIGAILIIFKAIESVFISAQRAFQCYGPAVRIGIVARVLTVLLSVGLALHGFGITTIMLVTSAITLVGAINQGFALRRFVGPAVFRIAFDREITRQLAPFGGFTWLQAVSGVIFGQADRLLLGASLGVSAVAYYGIAVQLAQPIHGLTAAGLHFIFPQLSSRLATESFTSLRRPILTAFAINLAAAFTLTAAVILCGPRVLTLWMGQSFADHASPLLPLLAIGFGLLALNVTAHYTLMAVGSFRIVTALNMAGGLLMLAVMDALITAHGVAAAPLARLCYGATTCLLYLPLLGFLRPKPGSQLAQVRLEQA